MLNATVRLSRCYATCGEAQALCVWGWTVESGIQIQVVIHFRWTVARHPSAALVRGWKGACRIISDGCARLGPRGHCESGLGLPGGRSSWWLLEICRHYQRMSFERSPNLHEDDRRCDCQATPRTEATIRIASRAVDLFGLSLVGSVQTGAIVTTVHLLVTVRAAVKYCPPTGVLGQGVCLLERSEGRFINSLRQRSYSALIFSSLSRLAVMDSSTELVPLIHAPPSCRRNWRISSDTVPQSKTSVTTVASSPSGVRM